MDLDGLVHLCKVVGAVGGTTFMLVRMGFWLGDRKHQTAASRLKREQDQSIFTPSYAKAELAEALRTYVQPDCGQADPSHEGDFRHVADIREPVFQALDRFVVHALRRRHFLVLGDSGMGKTSLCLNFYEHRRRTGAEHVALVSLSRPGADTSIGAVANKRDTLLIIDALDEDPAAQRSVDDRLAELLAMAADFKAVIVTCRSQFFRDARSIPTDTGVSIIAPRTAGASATYSLWHLYLMPFSDRQIEDFLQKQFPIWRLRNLARRRAARALVRRVPELSGRPMLLELVPDLIREGAQARELFDLYSYLVDRWVQRERHWIDSDKLMAVSAELAVVMHERSMAGWGDRVDRATLEAVAEAVDAGNPGWQHLSTRSLLNRDNDGLLKFAHRSIMEYFFVLAAIDGDDRCFSLPWTDVMRELFVSWGYTDDGARRLPLAKAILARDLATTGLLPLTDPPPAPDMVTLEELSATAERRTRRVGSRRAVSARWRRDSIRVVETDVGMAIEDIARDLEWRTPHMAGDVGLREAFLVPLAQRLRTRESFDGFRAPSLEELIALIEGLVSRDELESVGLNVLHLLGDVVERGRHLLAEVHRGERGSAELHVMHTFEVVGTGVRATIYEVSRYRQPAELHSTRTSSLMVRRLTADGSSGRPDRLVT